MEILKRQYTNPAHPISYAGVEKIYQWMKANGHKLSRYKIEKWLLQQEDFSVHKRPSRRFKRKRVISPYPGYMIDADTAFYVQYANKNDGYKYILFCIDVFSRFAWAFPLKTKTPKELIQAFKHLMEKGLKASHIRTDSASEIKSNQTQAFFKSRKITHFVTRNETKANFAERLIKSIKKRIARYMSFKQTHRWIDILDDVVHSYNHSYHRSIQMSPVDVTEKDVNRLWKLQYEPKNIIKKQTISKRVIRYKFKVGDLVRVSFLKRTFEREYDETFSGELFVVASRKISQGLAIYTLKDYAGEVITGTFYEKELIKASESEFYKIEKVLRKRKNEVYVKWKNYSNRFNSWIKRRDLSKFS